VAQRILVVEDDRDSLDLLCVLLQGEGYETVAAESGTEAIAKAPRSSVVAILRRHFVPGKLNPQG
jgi:CheY-like chemotaxis protein